MTNVQYRATLWETSTVFHTSIVEKGHCGDWIKCPTRFSGRSRLLDLEGFQYCKWEGEDPQNRPHTPHPTPTEWHRDFMNHVFIYSVEVKRIKKTNLSKEKKIQQNMKTVEEIYFRFFLGDYFFSNWFAQKIEIHGIVLDISLHCQFYFGVWWK